MATKEIQYYKNGGSPFITISSAPEPIVNQQQSKDVHFYHYYNSRNDSPSNSGQNADKSRESSQQSYFVVAHTTFGRLTGIDPVRSTPGVGGLPSQVLSELQAVYAHIPNAVVIIINNNGKFTIQAQIVSDRDQQQNGGPQQNQPLPLQNALPQQIHLPPQNALPPQPLGFLPQNEQSQRFFAQNQGQYQIPGQFPIAQGQPVYYLAPGGHRQRGYDEETISDSDSDSEYDAKHRRRRRKDGGRTYLQRKYSEIYHEDDDEAEHRRSGRREDRGRNDRYNRGQRSARSEELDKSHERRTPGNIYFSTQARNKNRDTESRLDSRVLGDRR